jgi:hypothetical protein
LRHLLLPHLSVGDMDTHFSRDYNADLPPGIAVFS